MVPLAMTLYHISVKKQKQKTSTLFSLYRPPFGFIERQIYLQRNKPMFRDKGNTVRCIEYHGNCADFLSNSTTRTTGARENLYPDLLTLYGEKRVREYGRLIFSLLCFRPRRSGRFILWEANERWRTRKTKMYFERKESAGKCSQMSFSRVAWSSLPTPNLSTYNMLCISRLVQRMNHGTTTEPRKRGEACPAGNVILPHFQGPLSS